MPRISRVVVPGIAHHITQCGNNRQTVFFGDTDYSEYLRLMAERCLALKVEISGYCLMPNHIHLIATPDQPGSLSEALRIAHQAYSTYINRSRGRSGHLWQNWFYSTPMSTRHRWLALRYVELNPVRAKMVEQTAQWRWSSAAVHDGKTARQRSSVLRHGAASSRRQNGATG